MAGLAVMVAQGGSSNAGRNEATGLQRQDDVPPMHEMWAALRRAESIPTIEVPERLREPMLPGGDDDSAGERLDEPPRPAAPPAAPRATPAPTRVPPAPAPARAPVAAGAFVATHYGESYNGRTMGCGGVYSSGDTSILAAGPAYYGTWPCGTALRVCGAAGCIQVRRTDSCPGCAGNHVDLSESGILAVCGGYGTCRVSVEVLQ